MKFKAYYILLAATVSASSLQADWWDFLKPYSRIKVYTGKNLKINSNTETTGEDWNAVCRMEFKEPVTIDGKEYSSVERLKRGSFYEDWKETQKKEPLFLKFVDDRGQELFVFKNKSEEFFEVNDDARENITQAEHEEYKQALYAKKVYEGEGAFWAFWANAKIYHPFEATCLKYAVVAGTCYLGYKLCKKLFGRTEKPAPAKAAAKGKRVAVRAVS